MRAIVALLVLGLILAGCTSQPDAEPDAIEAEFAGQVLEATEETGVIRGVVVDEAFRKVPGVKVELLTEDPLFTYTDDEGIFGFEKLAPGAYLLQATKENYLASQQQTSVKAGEADPTPIRLVLLRDDELAGRFEAYVFKGFLECSITTPAYERFCGQDDPEDGYDYQVDHPVTSLPDWIQTEMDWEPQEVVNEEMSLYIGDRKSEVQAMFARATGTPPLLATINRTVAEFHGIGVNVTTTWRAQSDDVEATDAPVEDQMHSTWQAHYNTYNSTAGPHVQQASDEVCSKVGCIEGAGENPFRNEDCILYPALYHDCLRWDGVGAAHNQQFSMLTHIFYNMVPPADWRFSQDGDPPLPEP